MQKLALTCLLAVALLACTRGKRDIRDYYYPVLDLQSGKVYVYELTQGDSTALEYWYFRGFVRDSGIFLSSTNYDAQFQISQIGREKLVSSGALLRDYFVYEPDTAQGTVRQVPTQISSPTVFPFQVTDSLGVFLFSLSYTPTAAPQARVYLIRNRRYLGDGPLYSLDGQQHPTIRFGVREAVGYDAEGAAEIAGDGEEWYAKGIGLVYRRKRYGQEGGFEQVFRLKEIVLMEELERRAKGVLEGG